MVRPGWVTACALDEPDESEARLTALDLAARPPAKLWMLRCLLACGATPSARVIFALVRNLSQAGNAAGSDGVGTTELGRGRGGGELRECLLGAMAGTEWESNPLIPGMNLSVALAEAILQVCRIRQQADGCPPFGEQRS